MPLQTTNNLPYLGISNAITGAGTVQLPTSGAIDWQHTQAVTTSLAATGYSARFTVTVGRIMIKALTAQVTTAIQAQANATKWQYVPTSGDGAVDLCATFDITAGPVNTIYSLPAAFATGMTHGLDISLVQANNILILPGTLGWNCAATNTGAVAMDLWWLPLDAGAVVVGN